MSERRLCDIAPGERVEFVRFDAALDAALRDRLIAYGISPAQRIEVVQQRPLSIIVCDHAEIAVEAVVARSMIVRAKS
jgi:Fe2+ transport system protein FeoA